MPEPVFMTAEELERLRAELNHLRTEGRRRAREELKRARSFGDFHENAEFDEAKRSQAALEGRILELADVIGRAKVMEQAAEDRVAVGATIIVSDLDTLERITFAVQIAGPSEPAAIRVTPDSPIGRSLMGKRVLDDVEAETPSGKRRYRILSVSYPGGGARPTDPPPGDRP